MERVESLVSPTHKRTEGRAPVWGSEFTSKRRRTTGGGSSRNRCRLNVKLCDLRDGGGFFLPLIKAVDIKSRDSEIKSRRGDGYSRGIRGCWFVLLFRTLTPAAPPASPVSPLRGMIRRVLYTAAVTRPAGPHTDIQCRNRRRQNNRSYRQRRRDDTANDPNS